MFTMGDIQYFDQVRGLAELAFGEPAVLEHLGDGFPSFPLVSVVGAAIGYALLGPAGLIVNSIVSLLLTLALSRILLRVMGLNPVISTAAAAVLSLVPWFDMPLARVGTTSLFSFWHDRIGRPVGTIWLITLALIAFVSIVRSKHHRTNPGTWMLLALGVALSIQGNFHTGVFLGLACVGLLIWTLIESILDRTVARCFRNIGLAVIVGLLAMIPFFVARLLEFKPDGPQRLGMIDLPRSRPFMDTALVPYALAGAVGSLFIAGLAVFVFRSQRSRENDPRRIWLIWPLMIVLALFTMPISVILLGQGAQMFHFRETVRIVITIAFFSGAFLILQLLISRLNRRAQTACGLAVVFLIVTPITARTAFFAPTSTFTYRFHVPARNLTDIRPQFTELVKELESEKYKDAKVLGSFDPGVSVWWTFMHHGYTFMPDVLTSSMREADIEKRYAIFCRQLQLSSDEFRNRITMEHTLFFRIGQGIYTVNDRYQRDPLDTYTPEDQESIKTTSPVRAWNMRVSIPERHRLVALYESTSEMDPIPQLDLIVLAADEIDRGYRPDPARYRMTFSNGIYEVFQKIGN